MKIALIIAALIFFALPVVKLAGYAIVQTVTYEVDNG
jgi:hypothetical protein